MKKSFKYTLIFGALLALLVTSTVFMSGCGGCSHYYESTITKHPTCLDNGERLQTCRYCDDSYTETIYADESYHQLKDVSIDQPTCSRKGARNVECTLCGFLGYFEIPETGIHDFVTTERVEATCTSNGYETQKCSTCTRTQSSTLFAPGHSYKETERIEPTCLNDGKIVTVCENCNDEVVETLDASHQYGSTTRILEPTCEKEGKEEYTCTVCLTKGYKSVEPLGHKEVTATVVEPTCQATGLTAGTKCERCDMTMSGRTTVETVAHSYKGENCIWCNTLKVYTVTYVYEGDAGVNFPSETYKSGETIVLPATESIENDYTAFVGWFTSDGTRYTSTTQITSDVTLYARLDKYVPISDLAGLLAIADAPSKNYKLTANINANGDIWAPIDNFTGTLNGNGFSIYNIVLSSTSTANFGFVRTNNGIIKDLSFKDFTFNTTFDVSGTIYLGVVAGENKGTISNVDLYSGTILFNASRNQYSGSNYTGFGIIAGANQKGALIEKCDASLGMQLNVSASNISRDKYSDATSSLYSYLGGIVGKNFATVSDCQYNGTVNGGFKSTASHYSWISDTELYHNNNYVFLGGIVGENSSGTVLRCYSDAEIIISCSTSTSRNSAYARNYINSGIVAGKSLGEKAVIEHCYAGGTVTTNSSHSMLLGGFIGFNEANASIKSCYTTANVTTAGSAYVGGFIGSNSGIIQNSYSAGEVFGKGSGKTGGFVGILNSSGSISKCYSTGDVTSAGGDIGHFLGHGAGIVFKCYFMDSSTVMSGGTYLPIVTEYNTVEGIVYTKLWNEDFLINEMYWEDYGWIVIVDENPLLAWEMEANHKFVTTTIEPTCERGGFTIYNCTDCSRIFIKDYVDPKGHTLRVAAQIPATCGAIGYTLLECTVDGCGHEEKTDVKEKLAHAEETLSVTYNLNPTCTASGKTIYYCSACKNGDIVVDIEPLGHSGIYISTLESATCTNEGIDIYFCTREGCGEYELTVERIGHTVIEVPYKAPSCGRHLDEFDNPVYTPENGHRQGEICSVCKTVISGCEEILAHSFTLTQTITAPGCNTDGEGVYTCSDCEYSENKAIPKTGHTDSDLNNICNVCSQFTFADVPESLFTHIKNAEELDSIRNDLNGYYILDNDIDLTGYSWTPIGSLSQPFKGILFGAGHTIKGLSFVADSKDASQIFGLFAYNKGTVASVNLDALNFTVNNSHCVLGGIAAYNMGSVIGCSLTGDSVFKLSLKLSVDDYQNHSTEYVMIAGGIVGVNDQLGQVQHCKSLGNISAVFTSETEIISADALTKILALIYNTKAESSLDITFGGITGKNTGVMDSCTVSERVGITLSFKAELKYQKGRINSTFNVYAADLVGYNSGTVSSCSGIGSAYNCAEGYNYKNKLDQFFKGKLCEITVHFMNHSETSAYAGLIGGNEGRVIS